MSGPTPQEAVDAFCDLYTAARRSRHVTIMAGGGGAAIAGAMVRIGWASPYDVIVAGVLLMILGFVGIRRSDKVAVAMTSIARTRFRQTLQGPGGNRRRGA